MFIWEVSQPAQVGSHLILPGSHLGEMKIFHMNTRKWASLARWDRVFFNQYCCVFRMLKSDSHLPKKTCFICIHSLNFKNDEKCFLCHLESSFVCHDFLVVLKKRLDQKDKVNFKIHDVATWLTNNCNTHIAQYLTK